MDNKKIAIITEVRIYKVKNDYFADPSFAKIIERYNALGKITLITRIISDENRKNGYICISKECERFIDIKSIQNIVCGSLNMQIKEALANSNIAIFRVPSLVSIKMLRYYRRNQNKKYMVEVMGCAWDAYWNHGLIGKIIAPYIFINMKKIIKNANYSIYVTNNFLQKRYPTNGKTIGISNVCIKDVKKPKGYSAFDKKNFSMLTSGALNVKYKGQEYVIKALKTLKEKNGVEVKYYLAGKGNANRLIKIAEKNNVSQNVVILGMITKDELLEKMREADLYIQPSLQEGLPRSVIEAMSVGTVCLGTNTAGIPELIPKYRLFKRRNTKSIAETIERTINMNLAEESKKEISEAEKYKDNILNQKRIDFFKHILGEI